MKSCSRFVGSLSFLLVVSVSWPAKAQQPPRFDVPVINGPAGNFTCVTTPQSAARGGHHM